MKRILFSLMVFCFSILQALAQHAPPDEVISTFKSRFPKGENVRWEKNPDQQWQGTFSQKDKELTAVFDADGQWLATKSELGKDKLPPAVKKSIAEKYKGFSVVRNEEVQTAEGEKIYYLELEKGASRIQTAFYPDGKMLTSSTMDETEWVDD